MVAAADVKGVPAPATPARLLAAPEASLMPDASVPAAMIICGLSGLDDALAKLPFREC